MKALLKSFFYAGRGIVSAMITERNMRIHTVITVYMYVFLFAFDFFEITATQLAVIFIANGLVIGGELINTAIENTVDLVSQEYSEYAKKAKDCAAGAVLVFAVFSVLCGIAIMYQPAAFKAMFGFFADRLWTMAILMLSFVISVIFIFFGFGKGIKNK